MAQRSTSTSISGSPPHRCPHQGELQGQEVQHGQWLGGASCTHAQASQADGGCQNELMLSFILPPAARGPSHISQAIRAGLPLSPKSQAKHDMHGKQNISLHSQRRRHHHQRLRGVASPQLNGAPGVRSSRGSQKASSRYATRFIRYGGFSSGGHQACHEDLVKDLNGYQRSFGLAQGSEPHLGLSS